MKIFLKQMVMVLSAVALVAACKSSGGGGAESTPAPPSAPKAPANLNASAVSSTGITLTWTDRSDNESGFQIERSQDNIIFAQAGTVAANTTTYPDTGLNPSTTYYYRVRAYNSVGNSDYTSMAFAMTQAPPLTPPSAPSGLNAAAASSTVINLDWTDNSNNEDGFKIERSLDNIIFAQTGTAAANTTTYPDTGLNPSTTYYYRMRAYNGAGNSGYTGVASAVTQTAPLSPPTAPSGLSAAALSGTQINIAWSDNSNDEDGFKIERSQDNIIFAQAGTVPANTISYLDTGLTPSTTYYYKVRAYNPAGDSDYTGVASDTTNVLSDVEALYPVNGAAWNDYVKNDGASKFAATDTACAGSETGGYSACLHGGEMRKVVVTGEASCFGLTAADTLGVFNWTCDASTNPVRMVSTGLMDGKYLSDLIDFNGPGWKKNSVIVSKSGFPIGITSLSAWWSNTVTVNNNGAAMNTAGTIHAVTADATASYVLNANKVALVAKPGIVLRGAGSGGYVVSMLSRNFVWVEGKIDAPADSNGLNCNNINFSVFRNIHVADTTGEGLLLSPVANNRFADITANNTSNHGVYIYNSSGNFFSRISAANNAQSGILLSGGGSNTADNVFAGITAFNNNSNGVDLASAAARNNIFFDLTASNNGMSGIDVRGPGNTFMNVTAVNNSIAGVSVFQSDNNIFANLASGNNQQYGIGLGNSSNNKFTGLLKAGNNATLNCYVNGGTNPGLDSGTCANNGTSDAVLTTGVTLSTSFVAKVALDDAANGSDTNGAATYGNITDWLNFANAYRGWGVDGSAFANADNRGRCTSGTCRIWDWSLVSTDTTLKGVISAPTGSNTITHTWSDATTITFLRNAVELQGNGNGLCESGETCLYTPDIGSYQGHGSIVPAGAFTDGTLTGITLLKYGTNGYAF